MTSTHTDHDVDVAPELAALELADKPDGPGAAAMLAAGIGIFMLGFFTTTASRHSWSWSEQASAPVMAIDL